MTVDEQYDKACVILLAELCRFFESLFGRIFRQEMSLIQELRDLGALICICTLSQ